MLRGSFLCLCLALSCWGAQAAPEADLITDLPGLSFKPNFKQYSGYLKGVDATSRLHYWFVESSSNPSTDPLVLWLNGGPGCSSLLGLLTENGPFRVKDDAKAVYQNPFAWNQAANVIYLESPVGVGFSYSTIKNYTIGDNDTAENNYAALKDFFSKFPEYEGRDFYITGESYGGIYVPTLAYRVMKDSDIKLKGFAVGNGLSSYDMNDDSLVYFTYYHGLIGDDKWKKILDACCPSQSTTERCRFSASKSTECEIQLMDIQSLVWSSGLNVYNLYAECAGGVKDLTLNWDPARGKYVTSNMGWPLMSLKGSPVDARRKMMLSLPRSSVSSTPPCTGDQQVTKYLNSKAVREALHISEDALTWTLCSDVLNYKQEYDDMVAQYQAAIKKGLRIMVYNGDVDMACNFLGDEWFVDSLHATNRKQRQAWYYTAADGTKQNAGFVKTFENVVLVTVRGAGHMVPTDRPRQALEMFVNFIQNKPFKQ